MARKRPAAPRPFVENPDRRTKAMSFRATAAQCEAIHAYAKKYDMTISMVLDDAFAALKEKESRK